jgi:hypothetical protein
MAERYAAPTHSQSARMSGAVAFVGADRELRSGAVDREGRQGTGEGLPNAVG